jgi:MtN3 and saliva related transmembrane protein
MSVKFIFESLGVLGSLIICASIMPQVIITYKTKSAQDLSIAYLITLMLGIVLLITYSVYVRDAVFILGNALSLMSVGVLIGLWKKYHHNNVYTFNRNFVDYKERRKDHVTDDNAFTGYEKGREYVQKP